MTVCAKDGTEIGSLVAIHFGSPHGTTYPEPESVWTLGWEHPTLDGSLADALLDLGFLEIRVADELFFARAATVESVIASTIRLGVDAQSLTRADA